MSAAKLPLLKQRCNQPDGDAKVFWFDATDGAVLDGAVLGHGRVGVLLAPELGNDVCNWLSFAVLLSQRGYLVFLFDPCSAVLSAAASIKPAVAAVVSVSAGSTKTLTDLATAYAQPLNPDAAVARLKMPVLYLVDLHDDPLFVADARKLYAHTPSAGKRLVVLPGYSHGTGMFATEGTQLQNLILAFIQTSTHP